MRYRGRMVACVRGERWRHRQEVAGPVQLVSPRPRCYPHHASALHNLTTQPLHGYPSPAQEIFNLLPNMNVESLSKSLAGAFDVVGQDAGWRSFDALIGIARG